MPVEVVNRCRPGPTVRLAGRRLAIRATGNGVEPGSAWLVLRPEVVQVGSPFRQASALEGVVLDVAFRGSGFGYRIEMPGSPRR